MGDLRAKLQAALAKPDVVNNETVSIDDFDPWHDVITGIHGSYCSESDDLMIGALEAVRDRTTFEFINERGFAGEFSLYVLSGHGLTDYGASPRGGWPDHEIADLWESLIQKWRIYRNVMWEGGE